MKILDGKAVSEKILAQLTSDLKKLSQKPKLDIVLVGDNPSSRQYTQMKKKKAALVGIDVQIHEFANSSSTNEVVRLIELLNQDPLVTGLMVQLPLPSHIDTRLILNTIDPKKDADGLTSTNLGLLFQRNPNATASATALGVIMLLQEYEIELVGKNAVIIGRGVEVGLPIFALLMAANATVTLCHSHTEALPDIASQADILVSAVGKPKFITSEFVKKNAVVVDVGLAPDPITGKLVGDVDFDSVAQKAGFITPVPGGVGPMTIAALLSNTQKILSNQSEDLRKTIPKIS